MLDNIFFIYPGKNYEELKEYVSEVKKENSEILKGREKEEKWKKYKQEIEKMQEEGFPVYIDDNDYNILIRSNIYKYDFVNADEVEYALACNKIADKLLKIKKKEEMKIGYNPFEDLNKLENKRKIAENKYLKSLKDLNKKILNEIEKENYEN